MDQLEGKGHKHKGRGKGMGDVSVREGNSRTILLCLRMERNVWSYSCYWKEKLGIVFEGGGGMKEDWLTMCEGEGMELREL